MHPSLRGEVILLKALKIPLLLTFVLRQGFRLASLRQVIFSESISFTKAVQRILSEEDYFELQNLLIDTPDAGDVIPGSRGLRKIRVGSGGKGKRGGSRVIYYWYVDPEKIQFCRIYEKSNQENLSKAEVQKNINRARPMKKQEIETLEREALAMERGEITPGRVWKVTKRADGSVKREAINPETHRKTQARAWKAKTEAAKIRREINVTQDAFASMLGVSLGTVRKWERGTIQPSGAARTLLKIVAKHPEIVREAAIS